MKYIQMTTFLANYFFFFLIFVGRSAYYNKIMQQANDSPYKTSTEAPFSIRVKRYQLTRLMTFVFLCNH